MFALAERLGMTVRELGQRMTTAEFLEWMAYCASLEKPAKSNEPVINLATAKKEDLARMFM